jgi:hypothetical protein
MTNHLNTIAADSRQADMYAAAARSRRARSATPGPKGDQRQSRRRFQLRRRPAVA